jgi:hypothetical protein
MEQPDYNPSDFVQSDEFASRYEEEQAARQMFREEQIREDELVPPSKPVKS